MAHDSTAEDFVHAALIFGGIASAREAADVVGSFYKQLVGEYEMDTVHAFEITQQYLHHLFTDDEPEPDGVEDVSDGA